MATTTNKDVGKVTQTTDELRQEITHNRQFSIPIYLDQRIVFDLLAIAEGGFSEMQRIHTTEANTEATKNDVSGQLGLGLSNAFMLLRTNAKVSSSTNAELRDKTETSEDRVFTPNSLFSRLRDILTERSLLRDLSASQENLRPGQFVEFEAVVRQNPLIGYIEGFIRLMNLTTTFATPTTPPQQAQNGGRRKNNNQAGGQTKPKVSEEVEIATKILQVLKEGKTVDYIAEIIPENLQAVIPTSLDYFVDQDPGAVADTQLTVLGKIVRSIPEGESTSISLLRGTSLGLASEEQADKLFGNLVSVPELNLPEVKVRIEPPVIQIIPIAIYA